MKPMEGPMILGKGDMPQYVTHRSQQLDRKVNEACGRSNALGEGRYAPVCDSEQTKIYKVSKLLYSEICSSIM